VVTREAEVTPAALGLNLEPAAARLDLSLAEEAPVSL